MVQAFSPVIFCCWSILVAARAKFCGGSPVENLDSIPTGDMEVCLSVVSVVCCQIEVSASC